MSDIATAIAQIIMMLVLVPAFILGGHLLHKAISEEIRDWRNKK